MTVQQDLENRIKKAEEEGNEFMAECLRNAMAQLDDFVLQREIEES